MSGHLRRHRVVRAKRTARGVAPTLAAVLGMAAVLVTASPAIAGVTVTGAGSTWSQVAIRQWQYDVAKFGLSINYQGGGSTAGRQLFINKQVDFAVSELPFLSDELKRNTRPFAYLPIVAGGTSLMYNIVIGGHRVTNLHLDSATMTGIFTGNITMWNDPKLVRLNPFLRSYAKEITPVTRSDGSGTSWQLSSYMRFMQHSMWAAFCAKNHIPDQPVQFWPPFGNSVGQNGSDGVANYVANPATGPGTIGYVEYAYALERSFPVAYVYNRSGHFVYPTSDNDASALKHATFNRDNTQNLGGVYQCPEISCYPISSYSYMIAPTSTDAPFTAEKGTVLGKFILYFACTGQQWASRLGYSPLPPNLVLNDFGVVKRIPGAPAPPPLKNCDNPTITGHSKYTAPQPPNGGTQGQNTGTSTGNTHTSSGDPSGVGTGTDTGAFGATPSPIGVALSAEELHARQVAVRQAVGGVRSGSRGPLGFIAFDIAILILAPVALRSTFRRRKLRSV
jgi:phosphate transport system substrate-binding protein